jgi:hypothetical protein
VDSLDASAGSVNREVFLLPPKYRGPVLVIYDQPGRVKPSVEDGKASYVVPPDGVVRTSLPEPALGTKVTASFSDSPQTALRTFPSCDDMRRDRAAAAPAATCWLEDVGGTGIPPYIAFIVTDWFGIPQHYDQAKHLIDSVVFQGKLRAPRWAEPKKSQHPKSTAPRTVDQHVARLRNKLEPDPAQPRHLITVRKAGYRFQT